MPAFTWTPADYSQVLTLLETQPRAVVAARYGLTEKAVFERLARWRRAQQARPRDAYQPRTIATLLGCPYHSVRAWRATGILAASVVLSERQRLSSIADIRAFLEAGHALCPSIRPPATALFWWNMVDRVRFDLRRRWVGQVPLQQALVADADRLSRWRYEDGFPYPIFRTGRRSERGATHVENYLDRAAVRAWLAAHPARATRAGWQLLNNGT